MCPLQKSTWKLVACPSLHSLLPPCGAPLSILLALSICLLSNISSRRCFFKLFQVPSPLYGPNIYVHVCSVAMLCLTLVIPQMDCSPSGPSVYGIFQARILEWVAISYSRGSSQPWNQTHVSCIAGRFFTTKPRRKPLNMYYIIL